MNAEVERFFEKVVLEYNCGDIKKMRKGRTPTLSPFLACIMSGIDTVGGMLYGFGSGSNPDLDI